MGNFLLNDGPKWLIVSLWIAVNIALFVYYFFYYYKSDEFFYLIEICGVSLPIARASAASLNFCCMLILLPVCRNVISFLRGACTCLKRNMRRQVDHAISFHIYNAYMICFMTAVHYFAHTVNLEHMINAHSPSEDSPKATLLTTLSNLPTLVNPVKSANASPFIEVFKLTAGWSGVIITLSLILIVTSATEFIRRSYFEVFWYTHHLFVVFFGFLVIHGIGGVVRSQSNLSSHDPHYCSSRVEQWGKIEECPIPEFGKGRAKTWYWVVGPMILYFIERLIRYVRSHQKVTITKVTSLPSRVFEIQMTKKNFRMEPGQYIFIQCPSISMLEWHPFTLTSCSRDEHFSVHIRTAGDWTRNLAKVLHADKNTGNVEFLDQLPVLAVDGPYGTASEDIFRYQVDILVGAGIGITPFASVLKEIWSRLSNPSYEMKLQKVYFFWICPDMNSFEWFQVLLKDLERRLRGVSKGDLLDYNIYLSRGWDRNQAEKIVDNESDEYDCITGLRQKTHYGRPNWDEVFSDVREKHPGISVGVFLCGPVVLSKTLSAMSNKYTSTNLKKTRFFFNKENF